MSIGRSERLVGRDRELAALRGWLAQAGGGPGGVCVIAGEPGVGKSRLAAEVIAALPSSWLITRGRAADRDRPAPFRPIAEALLAASRHRPLPDDPDVGVFAAVLGHLVPAWRRDGGGSEPVVVVAEAVLRVLGALAAPLPAVMLIEDVQWADPETLAVLDYLADNVTGQRTAVVITVRSDTPSRGLAAVRDLTARRVATLVELARLAPDDITAMACECLGTTAVGADIRALVDRSGGLPFLVEELLATAARDGILAEQEGRWALTGGPATVIPDSYRESVSRRLRGLDAQAGLLTRVAAVTGLTTEMPLLSMAAGLNLAEAGAAAQAASNAGLVVLGQGGRRAGFRHALIRDAVLAGLPPGEQASLAARALDAVTGMGSGPPGQVTAGDGQGLSDDALEVAVDLAEQAGELARSARLLLTLAGRAMAAGALATAEACLRRAQRRTAGDLPLTASVDEALLELLAHKGDLPGLAETAATTLAALARLDAGPARAAMVHLNVAHAAAAAGDPAWAAEEAAHAQGLAVEAGDAPLRLSAEVATASALLSAGDTQGAAALARQVISSGQAATQTLVQAWMVTGRAERVHDLQAAAAAFDAAYSLARQSGSPLAELAALHELATVAMLSRGDDGPLLAARSRAEQLGAVGMVAQLDLQLAGTYALTGRPPQALAAAGRAGELAGRLGQVTVQAMALVQAATAHAVRGAGGEMRAAAEAALALAGDDPNVVAGIWGHAYALYALLREDRAAARDALDRAVDVAGRATGIAGLFWAPWALVSLLGARSDRQADQIVGRLDPAAAAVLPVNRGLVGYAHAVAAGLAGDGEQAAARVTEAEQLLAGQHALDLWRQLCRRLAAEAALAGGWGEPVSWLRECLAAFDSGGHRRAATACRVLLHQAGAPVPRRSGGAGAPPDLAALGVTAREADVLRLVADGLTNREIGERLFLSPRTVEKHIERLLAKTGAANRSQLVARAARRGTALCT
jgi:DNA-binding CsgD family transcriptional regulator